ncbi:MAG: aldehyde dehydrogenase family protein [Calditrichaeota bacterium]|nr:MAG: aldehyde dehydrogenase family protein [Calditrichota bacterium]
MAIQMEQLKKDFNSLQQHFQKVQRLSSVKERKMKLKRMRSWIEAHQVDIQKALYQDFHKPEPEVDLTEIKVVLNEIDHYLRHLSRWVRAKKVRPNLLLMGTKAWTKPEPKGVALIFAPWNFPFMLTIGPMISAVAAGNCVVLKPSELAEHTSELIRQMITELFPPEEARVYLGGPDVAQALLKLPFNHIFFTGSTEVGKKVMKAAAEHLASVTLELGGKNPTIVDETADVKDTAEKLVYGKFLNGGQSCVSPNFIFVHQTIHDPLVEHIKTMIFKMYRGNGNGSITPDMAHIIHPKHYRRVSDIIRKTVKKGAQLVVGGKGVDEECYIPPTVLDQVPMDSPAIQNEIFGPVMPVIPYDNLDTVLEFINQQEKPLALYIFSRSKRNIDRIINNTSSGGVCINDTTIQFAHPNLPFGGINASGIGKAHGYYGFLEFSNQRAFVKQRRGFTTLKIVYPPYTPGIKRLVKWIVKYI